MSSPRKNDRRAKADRLVEGKVEVEAAVVPIRQLRYARHAHVIDAAPELEVSDHRGAGQDDDGDARALVHQGVGDGA
jgi:hypothetical protein